MEPARRTTSPEGTDICLNDLDTVQRLLPPGDSASPEMAIEASSYPRIDLDQDLDLDHLLNYSPLLPSTPELAIDGSSSPNIDWDALNKWLQGAPSSPSILPSDAKTTMASQGAMGDSDLNEQLHRENTCLQVATIASSPLSPYASPPTFTSDATTSSGAPAKYKHHSWRWFAKKKAQALARLTTMTTLLSILASSRMMTPGLCARLLSKTMILFIQIQLLSSVKAMKLTLMIDWQEKEQTITHVSSIPRTKFNIDFYEEAIREILQVLRAACIIHKLPLAQTWATCAQQRKQCRRHVDENCLYCISTIDVACYVHDPRMQFFHEACSGHHLLPRQGVAGEAFTTNQPCFLPDIGSSSEQEYPLSHIAKIFRLKGAVAIRLRCTHTGMVDFVLEFFLPTDCEEEHEQNTVLESLRETVESLAKTLRMVTYKEMKDDAMWEMNEINSLGLQKNKKPMKRKRMARRSPVWNDFTEVMVGGIVKAKCNHCGLELCCDSKTHGTSSLKSHLERCKLNPNNRIASPL